MPVATNKVVKEAPNVLADSCAFWFGDKMHLSVSDNTWQQSVDEATGVPNGVDVNGSLPSTFLDGSTPKAQPPMEPSWGQFSAAAAAAAGGAGAPTDTVTPDWSLRTGLTPTGGELAAWSSSMAFQQQQQQQQNLESRPQQTNTQATAPMPIPERSSTEPLWRRRLNAKNNELSQLHSRMSAPDVNASDESLSPLSAADGATNNVAQPQADSRWRQDADRSGGGGVVGDHDFTHASPDTLRMLGVDPNSFPQSTALANVSQSNNGMAAAYEHTAAAAGMSNGHVNADNYAAAAQMAVMQAAMNNNAAMMQQSSAAVHSSSLPPYDSMHMLDYDARQSPRAFRRSLQDGDLHMFDDSSAAAMYVGAGYRPSSDGFSTDTCPEYMSAFGHPPSNDSDSAASMASGSKSVINKVIVPAVHGSSSDAIDMRTGEAGQMRHVCPHLGCDKHFSTSGHARRHSRIHDCLRPFECPHEGCHATFTRRDNCTQHQRARHRFQLIAHRIGDEQ